MSDLRRWTIDGHGKGVKCVRRVVTLSSGAAVVTHGLTQVLHIDARVQSDSAAVNETITWTGTFNADRTQVTSTGKTTIKSNNGSSTAKVSVLVWGY